MEAESNEKRLNEEKNTLIDTEKKYYDLEKQTENDLQIATKELRGEQNKLETITKGLSLNRQEKNFINCLNNINQNLEKARTHLDNSENDKARDTINNTVILIKEETKKLQSIPTENTTEQITDLVTKIKLN